MRVDVIATIRRFAADERGATAIEYAMIAAGVGATVAGVVWQIGSKVKSNFYEPLGTLF